MAAVLRALSARLKEVPQLGQGEISGVVQVCCCEEPLAGELLWHRRKRVKGLIQVA